MMSYSYFKIFAGLIMATFLLCTKSVIPEIAIVINKAPIKTIQ